MASLETSHDVDKLSVLHNGDNAVISTNSGSKKKKKKKTKQTSASPNHDGHVTTQPSETTNSKSSLDEELEWCIAQLELGMLRPGANKVQKQQNQRNIQSLRGSKTPLPKKRQLMRSLFGDYRSKMKNEPLPQGLVTDKTVKVEAAKPEVLETVGTYYRKSVNSDSCRIANGGRDGGDGGFRFNFNVE